MVDAPYDPDLGVELVLVGQSAQQATESGSGSKPAVAPRFNSIDMN